jgi:hypothetical protein
MAFHRRQRVDFFLGIALALLDVEPAPGIRPSQFPSLGVLLFSNVNFLGYLYGADELHQPSTVDALGQALNEVLDRKPTALAI